MFIVLFSWASLSAATTTYLIDASNNLTALANDISSHANTSYIVRFQSYVNIGTLVLNSFSGDSLVFIRDDANSSEIIEFQGTLFSFKNNLGSVRFRNLAFKAKSDAAKLIEGYIIGSENKNLSIDSCQIFGDVLNTTFISWLGTSTSSVEIKRNIFSIGLSTSTKVNISSDTVSLKNNYFNFAGEFIASATKHRLTLSNNTVNYTQFTLSGNFQSALFCDNNIFGHAPATTSIVGSPSKWIMTQSNWGSSGSITGNARFAEWAGFDYPSGLGFSDASSNPIIPVFTDPISKWSFKNITETNRGYQNPGSANYPTYNLFPDSTNFTTKLGKDSLKLTVNASSIPRVISINYDTTTPYSAIVEANRTFWKKDTALIITGPVVINSILFPGSKTLGAPMLFNFYSGTYHADIAGNESDSIFTNTISTAKIFVPVFTNQNTKKGINVTVDLSVDTSFRFANISRTGRTITQPLNYSDSNKRHRILQKNGNSHGFSSTTNAEGSGLVTIGITKNGVDTAFIKDSLYFELNNGTALKAIDSANKYYVSTNFASSLQGILTEHLSLGNLRDTLKLSGQDLLYKTASPGYQISRDIIAFDTSSLKFNTNFGNPYAFHWVGRVNANDSLTLKLLTKDASQHAYVRNNNQLDSLPNLIKVNSTYSIFLQTTDTNKIFLLATAYPIPRDSSFNVSLANGDKLNKIIATRPGNILVGLLDATIIPDSIKNDSTKVFRGGRKITLINMDSVNFDLSFDLNDPIINLDSVRLMTSENGTLWNELTNSKGYIAGNRIVFGRSGKLSKVKYILAYEKLKPEDRTPYSPLPQKPTPLKGNTWSFVPTLGSDTANFNSLKYQMNLLRLEPDGSTQKIIGNFDLITQATNLSLSNTNSYFYQINFKTQAGVPSALGQWLPIPDERKFSTVIQNAVPTYHALKKQLIGIPFNGNYAKQLKPKVTPKLLPVFKEWKKDKWVKNTLNDTLILERGKGYLFAAEESFQINIQDNTMPSLNPDTLKLDSGWNLISNPYHFSFSENAIAFDENSTSNFYLWNTNTAHWDTTTTLKPFIGYFIHADSALKLSFNPINLFNPSLLNKKSAPNNPSNNGNSLSLILNRNLQASLFTGTAKRQAPFLSPLEEDFSLQIGGYFQKRLSQLNTVDETLSIHSPIATLLPLQAEWQGAAGVFALLDAENNKVYQASDLDQLPLVAGENNFQLIAGSPEYVQNRISTWQVTLPKTLAIESNAPNPFRGETLLKYSLPGGLGSLRTQITVRNLQGKVVFQQVFQPSMPGSHSLKLDGSTWQPGLYICTLAMKTSQQHYSAQRKMLVKGGL